MTESDLNTDTTSSREDEDFPPWFMEVVKRVVALAIIALAAIAFFAVI